jgi:hypothetical protein
VTTSRHPRLWLRPEDLPRLRSWAANSNPIYRNGLAALAAQFKADMDAGKVPAQDRGTVGYESYPTEMYAGLFAFMSLVSRDRAVRADFARRARTLLMHVMNEAAKGKAVGQPFRDTRFATSDRSRWWGAAFPLTVDWIYPYLSAADKATIRQVFLRWVNDDLHADITTDNHPAPIGIVNNPVLVGDQTRVRYAVNNYYVAHMRNIGLMALALDAQDDPGNRLRRYLNNATGAWLYVVDDMLRHDARGGLVPEGSEYAPETIGYIAQLLLALHTARQDEPALRGRQVTFAGNPFWSDMVTAYFHSLSPTTVMNPDAGSVYQPAWYGDGQDYRAPDYIEAFGPLGLYDDATGNLRQLQALRWAEIHTAPGGAARLTERAQASNTFPVAPLYFMLFDPNAAPPADPRPSLPLTYYAPGLRHIFARTDWGPSATWFDYGLDWLTVDHQHGDANSFEFYRRGTWLSKERTGYSSNDTGPLISSSEYHNTLALQNSPISRSDYRHSLWQSGSQWIYGLSSGDGRLLARSFGRGFVYALGDTTALYNSTLEGATDITQASRSIVWLEPDHIIVYDRATSQTAGRFKRFWLQLPASPTVSGQRAIVQAAHHQQLVVTSLLPTNAAVAAVPPGSVGTQTARYEPMTYRLRIEAPGGPKRVRFLTVLQGADAGAAPTHLSLIQSSGRTPFAGAQVGDTAILFPVNLGSSVANLTYAVSAATKAQLITGLQPYHGYGVITHITGGRLTVVVRPGTRYHADSGGVLSWGRLAQPARLRSSSPPRRAPPFSPSSTPHRSRRSTPPRSRFPARGAGHVTYRLTNGHVYRIAARVRAKPEDVSLELNRLSRGSDDWLNTAANGAWLVLDTTRFNRGCAGWACLAIVNGDLSRGEAIAVNGQLIHPDAFSAVSSGGNLIVYPNGGGKHRQDLWVIRRQGGRWRAPVLLTGQSPYAYNLQPAISQDGRQVVFACGNQPYAAEGTAICEAHTDGKRLRVVLTPADGPKGVPMKGALLEQPSFAPDGSIVFEGDWRVETIWRLTPSARTPRRAAPHFNDDNSPCVLPDGRIVSLWFDRPGGTGIGELKVMTPDGRRYGMLLTGKDVADVGLGCGR